jgi:hypothetical protein
MKWSVQEMMDEHVNGKILKRVREDSSPNDESKESNIQHLQENENGGTGNDHGTQSESRSK